MNVTIRQALPKDVRAIADLVNPYALRRILLAKDLITYYEHVNEFLVAEVDSSIIGCGALHVMWDDLAEIRTLAVHPDYLHKGIGSRLLTALIERAKLYKLKRVFCLTFEVDFFTRHGFHEIAGTPVDPDVYMEMLRSQDDGVKEFLDLAAMKPNTLGNTRMLRELD